MSVAVFQKCSSIQYFLKEHIYDTDYTCKIIAEASQSTKVSSFFFPVPW